MHRKFAIFCTEVELLGFIARTVRKILKQLSRKVYKCLLKFPYFARNTNEVSVPLTMPITFNPRQYNCHHLRQVTSSATLTFYSQCMVTYRWSIWTDRLSRTVVEILSFKNFEVATLTFRGSRDVTDHVAIGLAIWGSYRWCSETITLSRIVAEIWGSMHFQW